MIYFSPRLAPASVESCAEDRHGRDDVLCKLCLEGHRRARLNDLKHCLHPLAEEPNQGNPETQKPVFVENDELRHALARRIPPLAFSPSVVRSTAHLFFSAYARSIEKRALKGKSSRGPTFKGEML